MKKFVLATILVIAAVLRLWHLDDYPAGLNADEAALGYNAYSLLLTGRDEHGHPWPVNLESFGDFKPAGYAYLLIPFVKFLGLTEFAVRLPSALFGIVAIFFIYLLANEILSSNFFALSTGLMLAVNPWHLHFSRGAWEVNVATTLILIGTWSFIKWLKNPRFLWLGVCGLGFVSSMYFYQSARVTAPLLGLGLAFLYRRVLLKYPKQVIFSILLLLLLLLPLAVSLIRTDAASRLSGVGLLADEGPLRRVEQLRGQHQNWNSLMSRLLHNRPLIYSVQFVSNYLDHFFGDFLFVNGDEIPRNRVPETGLLYLTDFIFLALGVFFILRTHNSQLITHNKIIWLWLLVAPIVSALTFQTPHALRAHSLVIPLTIIIAAGAFSLKETPFRFKRSLLITLAALYLWQFARYLHQYYIHYPQTYPYAWEYGFKELVPYVESVKDRYTKILVTDEYDQPYILFLFYSQFSPQEFQNNHVLTIRDKFNFSTVRDYGKYHFASTPWDKVRDIHSALIVTAPEDIPDEGVNVVKTINFPNDQPAFKIVSN